MPTPQRKSAPEPFPNGGIYLIGDRLGASISDANFIDILLAAMEAGVSAVQLRERALDDDAYLAMALQLARRKPPTASVILNRRAHLVGLAKADGVQLGADAVESIRSLQKTLPPGALIGVSCHDEAEIAAAARHGADFATISPLFPTRSKPAAENFVSINDLLDWQWRYALPLYPLGGIGLAQAAILRQHGFQRFACIGAVLHDTDSLQSVRYRVSALLEGVGA